MVEAPGVRAPDPHTILATFGWEPIEERPEDGYWCYEITDSNQMTLRLSWNILEKSLRTLLSRNGQTIVVVYYEGSFILTPIEFKDKWGLMAVFTDPGKETTVEIHVDPIICVKWSTLERYGSDDL
jgi:hypothetical protein